MMEETQWISQGAVQDNCLISSMPGRVKRAAFSQVGARHKLGSGLECHLKNICQNSYGEKVKPG